MPEDAKRRAREEAKRAQFRYEQERSWCAAGLPCAGSHSRQRASATEPSARGKQANEREREATKREDREPILLRPITLHECRHTFASLLIDAGVNAKAIQEFMGHATIEETFSRYGHLMPGARNQARALVDAYFAAASSDVGFGGRGDTQSVGTAAG
jgi:integrase